MLKKILSISGRPGLFKLVSQAKGALIVEALSTGKRTLAYSHDKVTSLGDIAMYTQSGEEPLYKVLDSVKKKENGAVASVSPKADKEVLRTYFAEILPDFDTERVYPTDISKLISWYNILVQSGITDFSVKEKGEAPKEDKTE
ncbi:MAG TPA: hypothetical protein DHU85_00460 [Porphyromonadaceae bacterium]|jgi:hypothetical protein|uniref:DUF5606 domain-containing protein n=1 Tax=Candidatus Caccoplasma intestinavium TaxID=2840716 RepID=A0A9D1GCR8_9BACT|nr:DUF5606 domain-containing protein [Coprobacter sp.]CDA20767.1 putative uncharacterized protein [Bacteroides sp. CAG:144]HCZ19989.1 hypothetical protein [Porphyromonadaceae bacterium]HIT38483.1 DUF5606 domain-containing protein [Candidatus Caccoplasma intestinavium]